MIDSEEPPPSPLFEAEQSSRYDRQRLIRAYQNEHNCRLVVFISAIHSTCIAFFEETLYDANPAQDIHLMLGTMGGDSETALRLVWQAQSRCKELTVIVPDQAKSAGTLLAIGADHILMGPTSDLGPIDPQIPLDNQRWAGAQAVIAAVEYAENRIQQNPAVYGLYASLLANITALHVTQAKYAVDRTGDQLTEAIKSVSSRKPDDVEELESKLKGPLIDNPRSHGTTILAQSVRDFGLPVEELKSPDPQWQAIWQLWSRYVALHPSGIHSGMQIFEGQRASRIIWPSPPKS